MSYVAGQLEILVYLMFSLCMQFNFFCAEAIVRDSSNAVRYNVTVQLIV